MCIYIYMDKMKVPELKAEAKKRKIKGFSTMRKAELLAALKAKPEEKKSKIPVFYETGDSYYTTFILPSAKYPHGKTIVTTKAAPKKAKKKRCPIGSKRNKKTGKCEELVYSV